MNISKTKLDGCIIIQPEVYKDERGYFYESYNEKSFNEQVLNTRFIQDNQAFSTYGVLRGLHFQQDDYAQAKLVRVVNGRVLDVAVDIRKDSKTFWEFITVELSDINKKQLFVPRGFAHGYVVLSEKALFQYKVDNRYSPNHESGILWDDKSLSIDWRLPKDDLKISKKDMNLPSLKDL